MKLSVVIPTLDEAAHLARTIASLPEDAEMVVADGGSRDGTTGLAQAAGARVVTGVTGRAAQMNLGAGVATGDVLLFLHADCALAPDAGSAIEAGLADPDVVAGSFSMRIEPANRRLRLIAWGSNLRARWTDVPYGDQGLFVRREAFEAISGFAPIPIMEDVEILRRLKQHGRLIQLSAPIVTTPRHWAKHGAGITTLINWLAMGSYLLGISPDRLAPLYHRLKHGQRPSRPRGERAIGAVDAPRRRPPAAAYNRGGSTRSR